MMTKGFIKTLASLIHYSAADLKFVRHKSRPKISATMKTENKRIAVAFDSNPAHFSHDHQAVIHTH